MSKARRMLLSLSYSLKAASLMLCAHRAENPELCWVASSMGRVTPAMCSTYLGCWAHVRKHSPPSLGEKCFHFMTYWYSYGKTSLLSGKRQWCSLGYIQNPQPPTRWTEEGCRTSLRAFIKSLYFLHSKTVTVTLLLGHSLAPSYLWDKARVLAGHIVPSISPIISPAWTVYALPFSCSGGLLE